MRWIMVLLLSLFALPAAAQTMQQEVFEGTIGKSPVVMEITTYHGKSGIVREARYFYTKYRAPILLSPGRTDGIFTEGDPDCIEDDCPPDATLTLNATGDGLSGTWKAGRKPTSLPVALRRISKRNYALKAGEMEPALRWTLSSEDALAVADGNLFLQRLYDSDLVERAEVRKAGSGYRPVSHRGTRVKSIRVTQHANPTVQKAVNADLDLRRYKRQDRALGCIALARMGGRTSGFEDWTDIDVEVTYLTPSLMFVEEAGTSYCGGPHAENIWTQTGYDLRTGEALDMNRLLKLYDTPAGWKASDERPETAAYRALKAKLTSASPWSMHEMPCDVTDLDYGLSFNDKGLVFSLTAEPMMTFSCPDGEYVESNVVAYIVPYAELKSLWRPEAKAYFPSL